MWSIISFSFLDVCHSINLMKHLSDIDLYGFCPERDDFYGVVCEICDAIVKPQALFQHMGIYSNFINHYIGVINSNNMI